MPYNKQDQSPVKLSITMTTFNQGDVIGETLDSIISQITDDCEILVLDGASTDNTESVVSGYAKRCPRLRYIRQDRNNGADRDLDAAVALSRGEYAWLMCSDDLMKPGAVSVVLNALRDDYSLVVVGMEIRDVSLSKVLADRRIELESDRVYGSEDMDRLYREAWGTVSHISCKIFKRSVWLARERQRYYGCLYMHLAVAFQEPLPGKTLVMIAPLICHRFGEQLWRPHAMEMVARWSSMLDTFCISDSTKKVAQLGPTLKSLVHWRAFGCYSILEHRRWIRPCLKSHWEVVSAAVIVRLPATVLNFALTLFYLLRGGRERGLMLQMLNQSPFSLRSFGLRGSAQGSRSAGVPRHGG